jgi:hypothetical protein
MLLSALPKSYLTEAWGNYRRRILAIEANPAHCERAFVAGAWAAIIDMQCRADALNGGEREGLETLLRPMEVDLQLIAQRRLCEIWADELREARARGKGGSLPAPCDGPIPLSRDRRSSAESSPSSRARHRVCSLSAARRVRSAGSLSYYRRPKPS